MMKTAILAGGCFWGMEDLFRRQKGIVSTEVGYTGGLQPDPIYENVKTGTTGHAEAIKIVFDPEQTDFEDILAFFFQIHDPTTTDRQGNDIGSQYRSAIFVSSKEQADIAREVIKRVEKSDLWPGPIVTKIEPMTDFWPAEDFHQDYLERYPNGYTCHFPRLDWVLPKS